MPGVATTSSFKTIAVENKLFDVRKVKEASARAAANKARRPEFNGGITSSMDIRGLSTSQISLTPMTGSVMGGSDGSLVTLSSADLPASGAFGSIQAASNRQLSSFPTSSINVDVRFGQASAERSTGQNVASVQTDGSFLELSSGGSKTPSTPSKSAKTKFHDQASLLAMVSEQISKRLTSTPSENLVQSTGRTRQQLTKGFSSGRMPFTGPASAWDRQPALPQRVDVFIPEAPRPPAAVRVDLPPPPFDPIQSKVVQQTIEVNPRIDQFPQVPLFSNDISKVNDAFDPPQRPIVTRNDPPFLSSSLDIAQVQPNKGNELPPFSQNINVDVPLAPNIGTTGQASSDTSNLQISISDPIPPSPTMLPGFTISTVPTTMLPDVTMPVENAVNATSFFLDPFPTDPGPVTGIKFDNIGSTMSDATGLTMVDPPAPGFSTDIISPSSFSNDPIVTAPDVDPFRNINIQSSTSSPVGTSMVITTEIYRPAGSTGNAKNSSGSKVLSIGIVDITNATVANETMVQYDMTPFQSNENWAIFDPSTLNVNFSDYGPILDIPIDTNQISFTSNTNTSSMFSQTNIPSNEPVQLSTSETSAQKPKPILTNSNAVPMKRKPSRIIKRTEVIRPSPQIKETMQPMGGITEGNNGFLQVNVQTLDSSFTSGGSSQQPVDLPPPPF